MLDQYHYAYLIGDLILAFPVWAVIFYFRKDLRKEMILAGILLGIISVLTEPWYSRDYWHPEGLDYLRRALGDFFFGFFPGSVACVIYEAVLGKKLAKRHNRQHHWKKFFWLLLLGGGALFLILVYHGINSIYASSISLVVIALAMTTFRKDLFWDAVLSSLLFGLLCATGYEIFFSIYPGILQAWWLSAHASGLIAGIPIGDLTFEFSLGMAMGPIYEFLIGAKLKNK